MSRRPSTRQPRPSWVIARTDLRQLLQARDFWLPLDDRRAALLRHHPDVPAAILGDGQGRQARQQARATSSAACPRTSRHNVHGQKGPGAARRTRSRSTCSRRSRSSCRSRCRRRSARTRSSASASAAAASSSPTPPPPSARSTSASSWPASSPATSPPAIGLPAVLARRQPDRRTQARRLVLPDRQLVDPHAVGVAAVHRARVGGDPRHLGAGVERGGRAAGVGARDAAADRDRLRRVERHALPRRGRRVRHRRPRVDAARSSRCGARRRPSPANASSAWVPHSNEPASAVGKSSRHRLSDGGGR